MKKLEGKKILMVIAKNKFRDEEYLEPRKALESERREYHRCVVIAGPRRRDAGPQGQA